jgi:hypothetical protein
MCMASVNLGRCILLCLLAHVQKHVPGSKPQMLSSSLRTPLPPPLSHLTVALSSLSTSFLNTSLWWSLARWAASWACRQLSQVHRAVCFGE